ncbi:stage II sporulation protein M [Bacillus thuringiensis]|nr:stage II sporulation protein M [Bacillus toyonensis biovar Thuringiensis]
MYLAVRSVFLCLNVERRLKLGFYFNKLKVLFVISALIFFIGVGFGVFSVLTTPLEGNLIQNQYKSGWSHSFGIFKNNLTICLGLVLGIFTFGIPTFFLLLINGISIGAGLTAIILLDPSFSTILTKVLPHGIFEISIFLFSGAVGFLGFSFYFRKEKPYKQILKYISIIIIMVFISALIEGFIST